MSAADSRRSELVVRDGRVYHLGLRPEEVAPRFVLVGDPARAHKVAARFDSVTHQVEHREYVTLTGRYGGLDLLVRMDGPRHRRRHQRDATGARS